MSRWAVVWQGALDEMVEHSTEEAPAEACGLLLGSVTAVCWHVEAIVRSENVADDPMERFEIDPEVQRMAWHTDGSRVIGFYHSHPTTSPVPSNLDLAAVEDGWLSVIVGLGEVRAYDLERRVDLLTIA